MQFTYWSCPAKNATKDDVLNNLSVDANALNQYSLVEIDRAAVGPFV